MNMKKTILIYVSDLERADFFKRFSNGLKKLNYHTIFLTGSWSTYQKLKKHDLYTKRLFSNRIYYLQNLDLNNSVDILAKIQNINEGKKLANIIAGNIHYLSKHYNIVNIWTWNGSDTIGLAIKEISKILSINTCFFEISNLKGKIFIDPIGVNAQSYIFQNKKILENFQLNDNLYESWFSSYKRHINSPIPQVKLKQKLNTIVLFDSIMIVFFGWPKTDYYSVISRIIKKIKMRLIKKNTSKNTHFGKYVFLPLQLNEDSQVILNGNSLNNEKTIDYCIEYASTRNLELIVKPHPAETNFDFINYLKKRCILDNFTISNNHTSELIAKSEIVITINSTVGLQAILENKEVIFLGKSLYSFLDSMGLKTYICNYLIDIEYASNNDIDIININKIIKRSQFIFNE